MDQEMGPQNQLDTHKMGRCGLAAFCLKEKDFSEHRAQYESLGQGDLLKC